MRADPRTAAEAFLNSQPLLSHLPAHQKVWILAAALEDYRGGAVAAEGPQAATLAAAALALDEASAKGLKDVRFEDKVDRLAAAFAAFAETTSCACCADDRHDIDCYCDDDCPEQRGGKAVRR